MGVIGFQPDPDMVAYAEWARRQVKSWPQWKQDIGLSECCRGVIEVGNVCRARGGKIVVIDAVSSNGPLQYSGHLIGNTAQEWNGPYIDLDKLARSESQYRDIYLCKVHDTPYHGGHFGLGGGCYACEQDPEHCPHDLYHTVGANVYCVRCHKELCSGGDYSWWPP